MVAKVIFKQYTETNTKARPNMIKFKKIQKSSKGRHFSIHSPSMLGSWQ
jgi:hypothetical protein